MPVTAKLSRKFYEKFGDEIANELVEWFNAVDATYKVDLRELNESNFQRFEAKLGELRAELSRSFQKDLAETKADLIKWMVILWSGSTLTILGFTFVLVKL